jgi:hypothetical protein
VSARVRGAPPASVGWARPFTIWRSHAFPEALAVVALRLGLRRGEALGLRWEDVGLGTELVSCGGLAASNLAGQPGAKAADVRDAFAEAADRGITPGALIGEFSRSHLGSVEACFEGP